MRKHRGQRKILFKEWKKAEVVWLFTATGIIFTLSLYWGDTAIGIISAISGVMCSILAAKGKVSSYVWGLINCALYAYIAFENRYFGECMLNALYFVPMQFVGMMAWKRHMNENTNTVKPRAMTFKNKASLVGISVASIAVYGTWLNTLGGRIPYIDATTNVINIIAMVVSIKRYIEQWILFILIDIMAVGMWIFAMAQGSDNFGTLLMWLICLGNDVWGYIKWSKESKQAI